MISRCCVVSIAHNDPLFEADPDSHIPLTEEERLALPAVWHDIVQVHPVTGRSVLYMNFDPIEFDSVSLALGEEWLQQALADRYAGAVCLYPSMGSR